MKGLTLQMVVTEGPVLQIEALSDGINQLTVSSSSVSLIQQAFYICLIK